MRNLVHLLAFSYLFFLSGFSKAADCNEACLDTLVGKTLEAITSHNPDRLPWANQVKYTENGVSLMVGDGLWGSAGKIPAKTLFLTSDAASRNAVWIGIVRDHDKPAFAALRLAVEGDRIAEIEMVVARERNPGLFGDTEKYSWGTSKVPDRRDVISADRLISLANAYLDTKQKNDGVVIGPFSPACRMFENGQLIVSKTGNGTDSSCKALLERKYFRGVGAIRDRRFPVAQPSTGIVVSFYQQDLPARAAQDAKVPTEPERARFPQTRSIMEVIRVMEGSIQRIDTISVYQPYRMKSGWPKKCATERVTTTCREGKG